LLGSPTFLKNHASLNVIVTELPFGEHLTCKQHLEHANLGSLHRYGSKSIFLDRFFTHVRIPVLRCAKRECGAKKEYWASINLE